MLSQLGSPLNTPEINMCNSLLRFRPLGTWVCERPNFLRSPPPPPPTHPTQKKRTLVELRGAAAGATREATTRTRTRARSRFFGAVASRGWIGKRDRGDNKAHGFDIAQVHRAKDSSLASQGWQDHAHERQLSNTRARPPPACTPRDCGWLSWEIPNTIREDAARRLPRRCWWRRGSVNIIRRARGSSPRRETLSV